MICPGGCVEKAPNPTKKVYSERTIELGIFVDKYLWEVMKVRKKKGEMSDSQRYPLNLYLSEEMEL